MRTAIGHRLSFSPGRSGLASGFAVLIVAVDLVLSWWNHYPESSEGRSSLAVLALAGSLWLVQGDLTSLGFQLSPSQGWWYWVRPSLWIGLAVGGCIVVGFGGWVLSGHRLPIYRTAPGEIGEAFLRMCVFAPVIEETIYRLVLCMPLAVSLGPWKAIGVSGLVFGALHFAYGNAGPENLIGGYFLAWVYLKSESILVPVLLHGLGNLCALCAQVGAWYWLG